MAKVLPMISLPAKQAEDVAWRICINDSISGSYGEDPDAYASECAEFEQCRKCAMKGFDKATLDSLYKYLGQLELVELRFPKPSPTFQWYDAFTQRLVTHDSIAFEKACVLFQIAAVHSILATTPDIDRPDDLKLAIHRFRTSAGLLTYILESLTPLPSADLSQDVLKCLIDIMMVQATELCFVKCVVDCRGNTLKASLAAQAASMNSALIGEAESLAVKNVFHRNWVVLLQIKSEHFSSLAQFYRAEVDVDSGMYGAAIGRLTAAESSARAASKISFSFAPFAFLSPRVFAFDTFSDTRKTIQDHLTLCKKKKDEIRRCNDYIYNLDIPGFGDLQRIDGVLPVEPAKIDDLYHDPGVQKFVGPDMFGKLIPLVFRESSARYSEEKAELLRAESERVAALECERSSILRSSADQQRLQRFKAVITILANPDSLMEFEHMYEATRRSEKLGDKPVSQLLSDQTLLRDTIRNSLSGVEVRLTSRNGTCRTLRAKYGRAFNHLWFGKRMDTLHVDLRSFWNELRVAEGENQRLVSSWDRVKNDILLLSRGIPDTVREDATPKEGIQRGGHDVYEKISGYVESIEQRILRSEELFCERRTAFNGLKEKIKSDDISPLFILARNQEIGPSFFYPELEKFKPFQDAIVAATRCEQDILLGIQNLWNELDGFVRNTPHLRKLEEREEIKERFRHAFSMWEGIRQGLAKSIENCWKLSESVGVLSVKADTLGAELKELQEQLKNQFPGS